MKILTNKMKDLDEKREGLDIEITDLLAEMDTQASYDDIEPDTKIDELPKNSKVSQIVDKLVERQRKIDAQQKALQDLYLRKKTQINADVADLDALKEDIGKELLEIFGPENQAAAWHRRTSVPLDYFEKMRELRVER